MIQKIQINELEDLVKSRNLQRSKIRKKIQDLKSQFSPSSTEYQDQLKSLKSEMPAPIFLEEDTTGIRSGGYKRGKEIEPEDINKLKDLGYTLLWVKDSNAPYSNDEEYNKWNEVFHEIKSDIDDLLGRCMNGFDEAEVRKPGSSIKIFNGDDLIRPSINPLQADGARIIFTNNFGEAGKKIVALSSLSKALVKKCSKIGLFDNTCIGNLYRAKDSEEVKHAEPTNFFLKTCLSTGMAFSLIINTIQKMRIPEGQEPPTHLRDIEPGKRHAYMENQIADVTFAAYFVDYGYLHSIIDRHIQRESKPLTDLTGKMVGKGCVDLDERTKSIIDRHCNVSVHIIGSLKKPKLVDQDGQDLLQFHHRYLNGSGYPKRKMDEERITTPDGFGGYVTSIKNLFDHEISEFTRLASVINTFVEYLFGTPWRLPYERDNLVRYFLLHREYPNDPNKKPDKRGIYDINTREKLLKRFDGYLVDLFFEHIVIYKIGELIPICSFKNPTQILHHATVAEYTNLIHRPIVEFPGGENIQRVDLSLDENSDLFISEYHPCLRFKNVLQIYAPGFESLGNIPPEDEGEEKTQLNMVLTQKLKERLKEEKEQKAKRSTEVESLFESETKYIPTPSATTSDSFDVDNFLASFTRNGNKAEPQESKVSSHPHTPTHVPSNESEENFVEFSVPLPENPIYLEGEDIDLMQYGINDFIFLNYVEELDSRKYPEPPSNVDHIKGVPKYVARIQNLDDVSKPVVKFIRFIKGNNDEMVFVKDKYYGQDIQLNRYPYFKIDRMLTARELADAIQLEFD